MCIMKPPKIKAPPPPAQMQAMQAPKDMTQQGSNGRNRLRRRGMWASIFTSPQGVAGLPNTTGGGGSFTGG